LKARFCAPRWRARFSVGAPDHERGASIVEVIVSVVILSIFGIAAMATVSQGTVTSADNRARVGAAGLAQREA
jgi:type II secretory pathway pseudopilin PulG